MDKNQLFQDIHKYVFYYKALHYFMFCRPGSIKVNFRMLNNDRYRLQSNSPSDYASSVASHIKESAKDSVLPIDQSTVELRGNTVDKNAFSASYDDIGLL